MKANEIYLEDEVSDSKKFIKKPRIGSIVKVYYSEPIDEIHREHWQRYGKVIDVVFDNTFEGREIVVLNEIEKPNENDITYYFEQKKVHFDKTLSLKYDVRVMDSRIGKY